MDIKIRAPRTHLWQPTPYEHNEEAMTEKEIQGFGKACAIERRWDVVLPDKKLRCPDNFSYSPLEGYVSALAPWWTTALKYLKDCYTRAHFSTPCDVALAFNAIRAGSWVVTGADADGGYATGPRDGWD